MNLYIDDDTVSGLLVRLLRQADHDVRTPMEAGLAGAEDPVHLTRAVTEARALLSGNHDDFQDLHHLARALQGLHHGIIIVCKENNPKRDMDEKAIVRAIAKLEASGSLIPNQFIILNHWR